MSSLFFPSSFSLNDYNVHPWIWNEHWWDESSSYRVVPTPAGSLQSQGPRTAHCKGERSHPPAHSFTQAMQHGNQLWNLTHRKTPHIQCCPQKAHSAQTSDRHMQGSLGLEKPWSLRSEAADPPQIPSFSSPTTARLCQHTCLYGLIVNQGKEMKVPGLFYRYINYVSLYIYYGTFLLAFGTLLFACWVLSLCMTAQWYS